MPKWAKGTLLNKFMAMYFPLPYQYKSSQILHYFIEENVILEIAKSFILTHDQATCTYICYKVTEGLTDIVLH